MEHREREIERAEERRFRDERMDRRAHVVTKAGQGQLRRPGPAADGLVALEEEHGPSRLRERHGCGEPVRPSADDDGV